MRQTRSCDSLPGRKLATDARSPIGLAASAGAYPTEQSSFAAAVARREVMRPRRRPSRLDGALQRVIRMVGLSHPANLSGIAGPDRMLVAKLPLARPISRQAEPGASLEVLSPSVLAGRVAPCPVLPASGLIPLRRSPAFAASGDIPSAQTSGSSLRTFAFRTSGDGSDDQILRTPIRPRVMHRRSTLRAMFRYSRFGFSATWPGAPIAASGGTRGVRPFAVLLLPRGEGCASSAQPWPTCRFPCIHPGPFLPGDRSPEA
jgi:hypothetical protein